MSVSAVSSSQNQSSPPANDDYVVKSGDTLSGIAERAGVSLSSVISANPQISNPHVLRIGQAVTIPDKSGAAAQVEPSSYAVKSGDTLSAISDKFNLDWRVVAQQNNISNPDLIRPGQVLSLNGGAATPVETPQRQKPAAVESAAPVAAAGLNNGSLSLSAQDVVDLKKTLQTEWVQSAGDDQARGIVDTIMNRQASGRWGDTVADVVNARNQFSDINGPISRRDGRNSVDDLPDSRISARVDRLVDDYLAQRADGTPSSVGDNLNYANPNYSDRVNLGWIMALDGPVLGRGDAIHRHGTTPDLERSRPGAFDVRLP